MTNLPSPVPVAILGALAAAACAAAGQAERPLGPDGKPLPVVYRISAAEAPRVQTRMRDALSAIRTSRGLSAVEFNAALTSAAASQARSMFEQQRPWCFGPGGISPIERVVRTAYSGVYLGEVISETYESELETLAGWMEARETRAVLLDPRVREIGFAWYQEPSGKLWWALTTGTPSLSL